VNDLTRLSMVEDLYVQYDSWHKGEEKNKEQSLASQKQGKKAAELIRCPVSLAKHAAAAAVVVTTEVDVATDNNQQWRRYTVPAFL
jgi:hypothetical protein